MNRKNLYKNLQCWDQEAHKKALIPKFNHSLNFLADLKGQVSSVLNWYTVE